MVETFQVFHILDNMCSKVLKSCKRKKCIASSVQPIATIDHILSRVSSLFVRYLLALLLLQGSMSASKYKPSGHRNDRGPPQVRTTIRPAFKRAKITHAALTYVRNRSATRSRTRSTQHILIPAPTHTHEHTSRRLVDASGCSALQRVIHGPSAATTATASSLSCRRNKVTSPGPPTPAPPPTPSLVAIPGMTADENEQRPSAIVREKVLTNPKTCRSPTFSAMLSLGRGPGAEGRLIRRAMSDAVRRASR